MALHIQGSVAALVFVVLFCSAVVVSSQCDNRGVDDTLSTEATGENVVTTAANKIRNSGIFGDDHQFLRRMAKVESDDGVNIGSQMGGIWRVDNTRFRKVNEYLLQNPCSHHQEDPCLQEQLEVMLCVDLDVIHYEELDAPLYSALYVMIYLVETLRRTIPDTIEAQALLWKADLNSAGSEEHFIMIARQLQGIYSQCLDIQ